MMDYGCFQIISNQERNTFIARSIKSKATAFEYMKNWKLKIKNNHTHRHTIWSITFPTSSHIRNVLFYTWHLYLYVVNNKIQPMNKRMRISLKVEWRNRKFSIQWSSWKQFILQCWHLKISPAHAFVVVVVVWVLVWAKWNSNWEFILKRTKRSTWAIRDDTIRNEQIKQKKPASIVCITQTVQVVHTFDYIECVLQLQHSLPSHVNLVN